MQYAQALMSSLPCIIRERALGRLVRQEILEFDIRRLRDLYKDHRKLSTLFWLSLHINSPQLPLITSQKITEENAFRNLQS